MAARTALLTQYAGAVASFHRTQGSRRGRGGPGFGLAASAVGSDDDDVSKKIYCTTMQQTVSDLREAYHNAKARADEACTQDSSSEACANWRGVMNTFEKAWTEMAEECRIQGCSCHNPPNV